MMNLWDERYSAEEYVYGTEPNLFLKEVLPLVANNETILFPGEGEGRNATYAAQLGYRVTAFDQSAQARVKALKLAEAKGVSVDYRVGDFSEMTFPENSFDYVAIIFVHVPQEERHAFLRKMGGFLKPGGTMIMEVYNKRQMLHQQRDPNAGGPRSEDRLYELDDILHVFSGFETKLLREEEIEVNEGRFHTGMASVIRFIGKKK
ncbi:MAG: methyltransferase domain-containing protein [Petrimonas sp.]|nr:methyltransferase domain-containing protein [Petrimonas sp.]